MTIKTLNCIENGLPNKLKKHDLLCFMFITCFITMFYMF